MTNRTYRQTRTFDGGWLGPVSLTTTDYSLIGGNSPRDSKGKLALRANSLTYRHDRLLGANVVSGKSGGLVITVQPPGANVTRTDALPPSFSWTSQDNQALARFNGKIRYGSASLGVTIASWKQSQEMIANRLKRAQRQLDRTYLRLSRDKRLLRKLRKDREPLAGQILETEFGWLPLIEDVKTALTTVCKYGVPDRSVRGVGLAYWDNREVLPNKRTEWLGRSRVTYQATVEISNPNLWLLNRMGLLNLPGIAWDLVPWSFVANMFGNFNQIIGSLTEHVGLNITDRCVTRSVAMTMQRRETTLGVTVPPVTTSRMLYKSRIRTLNSSPTLRFELRVPEISWETCLIAGALVVQRIEKINKLLRIL